MSIVVCFQVPKLTEFDKLTELPRLSECDDMHLLKVHNCVPNTVSKIAITVQNPVVVFRWLRRRFISEFQMQMQTGQQGGENSSHACE